MVAKILYKGEMIRGVSAGQTATLLCQDQKLTDNIVVKSNVKGEYPETVTESGTFDVTKYESITVEVPDITEIDELIGEGV